MNGVLNFSVLDGWWVEGYREGAGWALPIERTFKNQEFQDDLDAETIYGKLEQEIVPTFYKRNLDGIPVDWVQFIKKCIAEIAPDFTTKRMIDDYQLRFYQKLAERVALMRSNDFEKARQIAAWKKKVIRGWESITIKKIDLFSNAIKGELEVGKTYNGTVVIDKNELTDINIGVELVVVEKDLSGYEKIHNRRDFKLLKTEGSISEYGVEIELSRSGIFQYGIRMYPKNSDLPHRMDFSYVRWI